MLVGALKGWDEMEKCSCWEERHILVKDCGAYCIHRDVQICNGTKEREECSCNGDESKCNFYPEKRKGNKNMNTAEMWLKAQEDGMCYEAIMSQSTNEELFYQKNRGLFDGDGYEFVLDNTGSFNELMDIEWKLRTMTKSEAEARFNIKIVGD